MTTLLSIYLWIFTVSTEGLTKGLKTEGLAKVPCVIQRIP